ncbi:hypothetical protein [Streptomyces sp. NPDC001389]|uniref:hypothetical protein n=1 Tax=Streptomyces sp. NPDC001389 TaxID=3364569 RepID=UPI0036A7C21A
MADPKTDPGREGTRLIAALEKCWSAIQKHHPDLPPVLFITGTGVPRRQVEKPSKSTGAPRRREFVTRGHHWADRWAVAEQEHRLAELFIAGETVRDGGEEVLKTLLHEAAHALAHVRNIQDVSKGDPRWHRREFAELARETGLEPPRKSEKPLGFSNATLTDVSRKKYAAVIRQIDGSALPGLGGAAPDDGEEETPTEPETPTSTNGKRVKITCGCLPEPRAFPVTPKVLAEGPIICGLCDEPFTLPGEEDQDDAADPDLDTESEPAPPAPGPAVALPNPVLPRSRKSRFPPCTWGTDPAPGARRVRGPGRVWAGPSPHAHGAQPGAGARSARQDLPPTKITRGNSRGPTPRSWVGPHVVCGEPTGAVQARRAPALARGATPPSRTLPTPPPPIPSNPSARHPQHPHTASLSAPIHLSTSPINPLPPPSIPTCYKPHYITHLGILNVPVLLTLVIA